MASKSSSNNASQRAAREAKVRALWKRRELAPWAAALAAAPARAARPSAGPRLSAKPELDKFYFEELPRQLLQGSRSSSLSGRPSSSSSSSPLAALTAEQLARVVEWKLARGTWRPRLLEFARAARQADVAAAAAAAAGALLEGGGGGGGGVGGGGVGGGVGPAIDALCALRGVGPATATALLSAADPSVPFLSDEALVAVLGAREYSRPAALRVTEALRARAEELNDAARREEEEEEKSGEEKEKEQGGGWTASKVERALWSASRAEDDDEKGEGEGEEKEEAANVEKEKKTKKKRKLG